MHFIKYGRSQEIKNMAKMYKDFKIDKKKSRKGFNRQKALNFRNYLIASLVIGNGLRASNIMQLRLKDFANAEVDPKYPGHYSIIQYKVQNKYNLWGEICCCTSQAI